MIGDKRRHEGGDYARSEANQGGDERGALHPDGPPGIAHGRMHGFVSRRILGS